jgi:hypothetical protein
MLAKYNLDIRFLLGALKCAFGAAMLRRFHRLLSGCVTIYAAGFNREHNPRGTEGAFNSVLDIQRLISDNVF